MRDRRLRLRLVSLDIKSLCLSCIIFHLVYGRGCSGSRVSGLGCAHLSCIIFRLNMD
jgi:hypothetical protein